MATFPASYVTGIIFILSQIGIMIWFISRINIVVERVQKDIVKLETFLTNLSKDQYSKYEASKDFAYRDKEIAAMWRKVDDIQNKIQMREN